MTGRTAGARGRLAPGAPVARGALAVGVGRERAGRRPQWNNWRCWCRCSHCMEHQSVVQSATKVSDHWVHHPGTGLDVLFAWTSSSSSSRCRGCGKMKSSVCLTAAPPHAPARSPSHARRQLAQLPPQLAQLPPQLARTLPWASGARAAPSSTPEPPEPQPVSQSINRSPHPCSPRSETTATPASWRRPRPAASHAPAPPGRWVRVGSGLLGLVASGLIGFGGLG